MIPSSSPTALVPIEGVNTWYKRVRYHSIWKINSWFLLPILFCTHTYPEELRDPTNSSLNALDYVYITLHTLTQLLKEWEMPLYWTVKILDRQLYYVGCNSKGFFFLVSHHKKHNNVIGSSFALMISWCLTRQGLCPYEIIPCYLLYKLYKRRACQLSFWHCILVFLSVLWLTHISKLILRLHR